MAIIAEQLRNVVLQLRILNKRRSKPACHEKFSSRKATLSGSDTEAEVSDTTIAR